MAKLVSMGKLPENKFWESYYNSFKNHISFGNYIKFGYELDKAVYQILGESDK